MEDTQVLKKLEILHNFIDIIKDEVEGILEEFEKTKALSSSLYLLFNDIYDDLIEIDVTISYLTSKAYLADKSSFELLQEA